MKTLLVIRHAKSSWDPAILNDFDRPLNERGKKDARAMARRLIQNKIPIDLFVASPAKRAKKTAVLFAQEFKKNEEDIFYIPGLYHAPAHVFIEVVKGLDNAYSHVAVFSHNPGITAFVNMLGTVQLDNMPTCAVFGISIDADEWQAFSIAKKEFLFFDFPKNELPE
jgi:phosphohistidine phosphatase